MGWKCCGLINRWHIVKKQDFFIAHPTWLRKKTKQNWWLYSPLPGLLISSRSAHNQTLGKKSSFQTIKQLDCLFCHAIWSTDLGIKSMVWQSFSMLVNTQLHFISELFSVNDPHPTKCINKWCFSHSDTHRDKEPVVQILTNKRTRLSDWEGVFFKEEILTYGHYTCLQGGEYNPSRYKVCGDPYQGGTSISHSYKSFQVLSVYTWTTQRLLQV